MHTSTLMWRTACLALVAALVSSCSDAPVAPTAARGTTSATPRFDASDAGQLHGQGNVPSDSSTIVVSFTVNPSWNGTYRFGTHSIYFPSYSICDPATSGYGDGTWASPCTPLRNPITITAKIFSRGGHAAVDFQPALRFVPTSDRDRWVVLTLKDHRALDIMKNYTILWFRPMDRKWIDEAFRDPTLQAWTDRGGNTVSRRLEHFSGYNISTGSGYNISTGEACELSLGDPNCVPYGNGT